MKIYTFDMSFGGDLKQWRKRSGLTQKELSAASGVSVSYITNLERDFSANTRSGKPKASENVCERFSKVMHVPLDEVRASAGYVPLNTPIGPPKSFSELKAILENLGIKDLQFFEEHKFEEASPEQLQEILNAVQLAVRITFERQQKRDNTVNESQRLPDGRRPMS